MRRKIELYIGGRLADMDDQGLVLYNYAFTDLQTPAVVKNSFSKQVTLPATAQNAEIFGYYYRLDRAVGNGFDAGEKTPFEIYDDLGRILESGYLKLDSITRKGRVVTGYKVTLYGGLGALFYTLSYGPSGNKLTLADLDFDGAFHIQMPTFTINATTIRAAWTRLRNHDQADGIDEFYDIINFAPAYNGIPGSKFSADKAIVKPTDVGLPTSQTDGGTTYSVRDSFSLLNLSQEHDEWAAKDLRSYLQRPVFSMRAFLEAAASYATNQGFSIDISNIPGDLYLNVWKTLPMIPSLGTFKKMAGNAVLSYTQEQQEGDYFADIQVSGVPAGASQNAHITIKPNFGADAIPSYTDITSFTRNQNVTTKRVLVFVQCVAMNGSLKLGASKVKVMCGWVSRSGAALAEAVGFTPWVDADFEDPKPFGFAPSAYEDYSITSPLTFDVLSSGATYYRFYFKTYELNTIGAGGNEALTSYAPRYFGGFNASGIFLNAEYCSLENYSGSVYYETASDARTGAQVDSFTLLQSSHTPAEYLISFCKMHGLVFVYDAATKTATIMPRNLFFDTADIEIFDLTPLIDHSREITIQPLALKSKWYELSQDMVEGAFATQYETTYGVKYGIQRINTGYDLDTQAVNLMEGLAYKGAVCVLDHSQYWEVITSNSKKIPAVFVDKGNTYTLWDSNGKTKEFQVPCPPAASTIGYYNTLQGYDIAGAGKIEFRDAENKALEGVDVLCRYTGYKQYQDFAVTDDTAAMILLNNGTPCWDLTAQAGNVENIPIFSRYNGPAVTRSLDFGIPREMDYPGVSFDTNTGSLYLRYWRAYLADLLDAGTKVMKCRVDLTGMDVGPELLGRYWWYEGAFWVLNKINNYSLTTWDATECEFVQVQRMADYFEGQTL